MEHTLLQRRTASLLFFILALNFLLWSASHNVRARWTGIPPAPSENTAAGITLGDRQFAYRSGALTLQNLGDTGGRTIPLKDMDYTKLGQWFHLLNSLDPVSNHIPLIAAYYFGGIQASEETSAKIWVVIDYLASVGTTLEHDKWRWLAHAAFLARHKTEDLNYALELANKLTAMDPDGEVLPLWARHMPAFILTALDQKDAARALLEAVLVTGTNLHPNEANFLRAYLIEQLGVPEDEIGNSLVTVPQ
ncbi:MAG: hypothetical protein EP349_03185 [Alphaproteobacteria bacterium]|nr:MAG: hypothetical protein EP349_03185 [Alphaproteobacteria bacterium]